MLICYESFNEVLIATMEGEQELLITYFGENCGRDLDDYDRQIIKGVVQISARMSVSFSRSAFH